MKIDPYLLKRLPRYHPKRLLFTLWGRAVEKYAQLYFEECALPIREVPNLPIPSDVTWTETQVTPEQASLLLHGLHLTSNIPGCVVEVGAWRGVTTRYLAQATDSVVVAIDPWLGDKEGGNYRAFLDRTRDLPNVVHESCTSGEAARKWQRGIVRLVFLDAVHDYANVSHDLSAWTTHLAPNGIIAMHDVDAVDFAGCRMAAFEIAGRFELVAHIDNIVLFRLRCS